MLLVNRYFTNGSYYRILRKVPKSGKDKSVNDFYISTSADLAGLADLVNTSFNLYGKTFHLTADIDLGGVPWTPIGNETYVFSGTFEGGGHAVTGLYIDGSEDYRGLFGYIFNATVKDLSVSGSVTPDFGTFVSRIR